MNGKLGQQVLTGGPCSDRVSGVANDAALIHGPATYVAVLSTFEEGVGAEYEFTVYSSACPVRLVSSDTTEVV